MRELRGQGLVHEFEALEAALFAISRRAARGRRRCEAAWPTDRERCRPCAGAGTWRSAACATRRACSGAGVRSPGARRVRRGGEVGARARELVDPRASGMSQAMPVSGATEGLLAVLAQRLGDERRPAELEPRHGARFSYTPGSVSKCFSSVAAVLRPTPRHAGCCRPRRPSARGSRPCARAPRRALLDVVVAGSARRRLRPSRCPRGDELREVLVAAHAWSRECPRPGRAWPECR